MKVLLMPTSVILGSVEGIVFYDTNGDSTLGNSESVISNTVVTLKDSNGVIIATATSDSSGMYVFNNVMPGNKVISLESPSKYEMQFTVVAGKVTTLNTDLTVLTATVAGLVLQRGDTKLPISGVTIEMYSETDSSFQTITDSSRKNMCFLRYSRDHTTSSQLFLKDPMYRNILVGKFPLALSQVKRLMCQLSWLL
jgi:hypothetical protein